MVDFTKEEFDKAGVTFKILIEYSMELAEENKRLKERVSSPSYTRAEVAEILEWASSERWTFYATVGFWSKQTPLGYQEITTSVLITEYENRPENKDKTV